MKNRIALKLSLYFTGVLAFFGIVIGGIFYGFFQQHTVDIKRQEMEMRAQRVADVIKENMDFLEGRYGENLAKSKFINYIDNITPEIVSIVDSNRNLSMNIEAIRKHREKRLREFRANGVVPNFRPLPESPRAAYEGLPERIKHRIEEGFQGRSFYIEEYSHVLGGIMVTVGVPVENEAGQVKGVVLIHSSVQGLDEAVMAGLRILGTSILLALLLGIVISIVASYHFTRPLKMMKELAGRLADRDYSARNRIEQDDEIGDLAETLDLLAHRLQLADEESQKLEKLRRDFMANVSHELRTPVTVIRGSLEALRDGVITDPQEVAEFREQMYKESLFLERLINDLLDLTRLQNTDFFIGKEPLNLCEVINDAARAGRHLGQEKQLQVRAELDRDIYVLEGDYGRLKQMLMVFIHNSVKFSEAGREILLKLAGNRLQVIDQGCGIAKEDLEHAFERFYKAPNEQNKSGSGLGLAIAWQIAQRHNLQLQITSEEGQGTTIIIELPQPMDIEEA